MAAQRPYTDAQRIDALTKLAANGGNKRKTARETGIPESTLRQWESGDRHPEARVLSAPVMRLCAEDLERAAGAVYQRLMDTLQYVRGPSAGPLLVALIDKAHFLRQTAELYQGEQEQPIDLSKLTPEQLETLGQWLEGSDQVADRPPGGEENAPGDSSAVRPDDDGALYGLDVAGLPVGMASPGIVQVPGPTGGGDDQAADGIHATQAREERVSEPSFACLLPGEVPGQRGDPDELRGGTGEQDEPGRTEDH